MIFRRSLIAFVLGLILVSPVLGAEGSAPYWDYSAQFLGRTYPLGGIFAGTLGYNTLLWGDPKQSIWQYGYLRPNVTVATVGIVNRFQADLDFFPVSILGFRVGQAWSHRLLRTQSVYDCTLYECLALVSRQYIEAQLTLGMGQFFVVQTARWTHLSHSSGSGIFADDTHVLPAISAGDHSAQYVTIAGYKIDPSWRAGVYLMHSRVFGTSTLHNHVMGFGQWVTGQWSFLAGLGATHSSLNPLGFSAVGVVTWTGVKSLSLF